MERLTEAHRFVSRRTSILNREMHEKHQSAKVRIKVCGITSYEDAALALELGVDALGFNFYPASPRFLGFAAARAIIRRLPPLLTTVGVFADVADPVEVVRARGPQAYRSYNCTEMNRPAIAASSSRGP
jgi:hypothetical protein